jgi:hypothetical protein
MIFLFKLTPWEVKGASRRHKGNKINGNKRNLCKLTNEKKKMKLVKLTKLKAVKFRRV